MSCNKCKQEKGIVNKKYNLCYECNFQRTHKGETLLEFQKRKQKEYQQKQLSKPGKKLVSKKPIKKQTAKESTIKSKLSILKNEIRLEAIQNGEYYCQGCGSADSLDCSHILSVSLYKYLELVKENIQLLCRTCHMRWEGSYIWEMMELLCFESNLEIIKKYDEIAYNKLFNAWQDELNNYFKK